VELRPGQLRWHRVIGRVYVYGVVAAAPIGILIEAIKYVHGIAPFTVSGRYQRVRSSFCAHHWYGIRDGEAWQDSTT
jgi:hypothetical protein